MPNMYQLIQFAEAQCLTNKPGFAENSYPAEDGAYLVSAEWLETEMAGLEFKSFVYVVSTLIEASDGPVEDFHQAFADFESARACKEAEIQKFMSEADAEDGETIHSFPTFYEWRGSSSAATICIEQLEIN